MPKRLFVSNLGRAATLVSLRELFSTCGDVLDVDFAEEQSRHGATSAAYVTMATPAGADKALDRLSGTRHCDRILVITPAERDNVRGGSRRSDKSSAEAPSVAINQQYRDRHGLAYELSCAGVRLTLRFLFPADAEHCWRVEARVEPLTRPAVVAEGATRQLALRSLTETWGGTAADPPLPALDWASVAVALASVKAL